jgi:hypothetical protein
MIDNCDLPLLNSNNIKDKGMEIIEDIKDIMDDITKDSFLSEDIHNILIQRLKCKGYSRNDFNIKDNVYSEKIKDISWDYPLLIEIVYEDFNNLSVNIDEAKERYFNNVMVPILLRSIDYFISSSRNDCSENRMLLFKERVNYNTGNNFGNYHKLYLYLKGELNNASAYKNLLYHYYINVLEYIFSYIEGNNVIKSFPVDNEDIIKAQDFIYKKYTNAIDAIQAKKTKKTKVNHIDIIKKLRFEFITSFYKKGEWVDFLEKYKDAVKMIVDGHYINEIESNNYVNTYHVIIRGVLLFDKPIYSNTAPGVIIDYGSIKTSISIKTMKDYFNNAGMSDSDVNNLIDYITTVPLDEYNIRKFLNDIRSA